MGDPSDLDGRLGEWIYINDLFVYGTPSLKGGEPKTWCVQIGHYRQNNGISKRLNTRLGVRTKKPLDSHSTVHSDVQPVTPCRSKGQGSKVNLFPHLLSSVRLCHPSSTCGNSVLVWIGKKKRGLMESFDVHLSLRTLVDETSVVLLELRL